jgi:glycosyl hydrolase family 65
VILQDSFTVEPWNLRETHLDLDVLAQSESVFALANGHVGWRANLDEGEPHGLSGTYLNGVFELRPLPSGERAYGQPEPGQEVINVEPIGHAFPGRRSSSSPSAWARRVRPRRRSASAWSCPAWIRDRTSLVPRPATAPSGWS